MKASKFFRCIPFVLFILIFIHAPAQDGKNAFNPPNRVFKPELKLDKINLPAGFKIEIYAEGIEDARSMTRGDDGTLFIGNRRKGRVWAVQDLDGDHKAEEKFLIDAGLNMPNGLVFFKGDLYVAEVSRLIVYRDILNKLDQQPNYEIISQRYPTDKHHGWKYMEMGPDGYLYIPVGAPCNICNEKDPVYASITRIKPDGTDFSIVAHGIRNTVGFDWHPETGNLWFTENGRDRMGDDLPPDELNELTEFGQHFGYPFCHGNNIPDPEFGDQASCNEFVKPIRELGPHVAALGMKFYTGNMFPEEYKHGIFFAEHGSWNRTEKIGYRVMLSRQQENGEYSYEVFADGWLEGDNVMGRPVDLLPLPDGSLLLSDDYAGVIYRISYE